MLLIIPLARQSLPVATNQTHIVLEEQTWKNTNFTKGATHTGGIIPSEGVHSAVTKMQNKVRKKNEPKSTQQKPWNSELWTRISELGFRNSEQAHRGDKGQKDKKTYRQKRDGGARRGNNKEKKKEQEKKRQTRQRKKKKKKKTKQRQQEKERKNGWIHTRSQSHTCCLDPRFSWSRLPSSSARIPPQTTSTV